MDKEKMNKQENHIHDHNHDHGHDHGHEHHHHGGVNDYLQAVSEYRKTFPNKQQVIENTPDPAVKELLLHMEQIGCETSFDRFDAQQPQCSFGMAGVCCKNCSMGPCKITPKSPRGVCGADADIIVSRNMLRALAAGSAAHGAHGREVAIALKKAAEGQLNLPICKDVTLKYAKQFEIETEGRTIEEIAIDLADVLLEDLSRPMADEYKLIKYCAPEERQKVWADLDILPISAYQEVFEAFHRTNEGTDGDWENIMKQFMRVGLTFAFSGVVGVAIATDSLFGLPERRTSKVNVGALEKGYVNIAVHGHLPILVSEIVKQGQSEEFINLAKKHGAKGIKFYGICCSGLSAMYRYSGVIPLSNAVGAELVLGTGALDLWVADIQDVFPGIMEVAKCFKTTVVTTSDSARLQGAEHYAYDHEHSNLKDTEKIARKIVTRAIESFAERRDVPVFIPPYEVDAEVGFSSEYVVEKYGSMKPLYEALRDGKILGITNMVGCNNPRVIYERATVDIANKLIKNNVLILTNGCVSFPLLKLGFCNKEALQKTGEGLKEFLGQDTPPVWHVGECIDNTRSVEIFAGVAAEAGKAIKDMPYAFCSPEWSNEKGIGASFSFRLLGISSYHCVMAPIMGSDNVKNFLLDQRDTLGCTMNINVNPDELGDKILADLKAKRKALGWK